MGSKILVIDDDVTSSVLMKGRLIKAGYEVVLALNGQTGLEAAKVGRPDLIILDIEMPELNGYAFVVEIKKDPALSQVPVIVLTSHEENRPIFARRGIGNYLIKPVNFDLLFAKMKELLPKS